MDGTDHRRHHGSVVDEAYPGEDVGDEIDWIDEVDDRRDDVEHRLPGDYGIFASRPRSGQTEHRAKVIGDAGHDAIGSPELYVGVSSQAQHARTATDDTPSSTLRGFEELPLLRGHVVLRSRRLRLLLHRYLHVSLVFRGAATPGAASRGCPLSLRRPRRR